LLPALRQTFVEYPGHGSRCWDRFEVGRQIDKCSCIELGRFPAP
jgi:hypothetical protein